MNSFVTFRCQNQAKVRSFVGKKHVSKIARLQVQGGVIALESTALVVVSDRGVGRIKSYRGTELDVFDPKARAHASHHGLSWQVFSRNGKGRVFDQSEKPWENPARRWIQSMDLRQAWKTPWKGLAHPYRLQPAPGCHQDSGAFCLSGKTIISHDHRKSLCSSRPESVATWFDSGLLRCSGVVRGTIQYNTCAQIWVEEFLCDREWGWIADRDPTFNQESFRPQEFAFWIWCC